MSEDAKPPMQMKMVAPTKKTSPVLILVGLVVALTPLMLIGFAERNVVADMLRPALGGDSVQLGSVGADRQGVLQSIAQSARTDIGFKPKSADDLPPVEYMNRKLAERGLKWRVTSTEGGQFKTRDVS
jgi:hypothetical protein